MADSFLYEELNTIKKTESYREFPHLIQEGLAENISLRDYQVEAIRNFITYFENKGLRNSDQIHSLFHMATGSGKTVIMAGLILYLYSKGYRKFIFFVNQKNILKKTEDNFLNAFSSKYLFASEMTFDGLKFNLKKVDNFTQSLNIEEIELIFTTTQKLHTDLNNYRENSPTYDDFRDD